MTSIIKRVISAKVKPQGKKFNQWKSEDFF